MKKIIKNQKIPIRDIVFDETLYPRTQTYWQVIYDYSESLKTGAKFPPIALAMFRGKKVLMDGKHRLEAHRLLKLNFIQADVVIGLTREEIFEEAIRRNIAHGKVLSPYEKRKLILKLKGMKFHLQKISDLIQIPMDRIDSFMASNLVNSITGEQVVTKSPLGHLAGKTLSPNEIDKLQKSQRKLSMGMQINFLKQLRDLLKEKLINKKDERVSKLIEEIKGYL